MALNILVVDDEPVIRRVTREFLEDEGYAVSEAENGSQALTVFRSQPIDLILMDINMPGSDGMTTLRIMISEKPETRVIMISAHGNVETVVDSMKSGAGDYLEKPFSFETLKEKIKHTLAKSLPTAPDHTPKGSLFGRYRILEEIGSGGSATVYKAFQPGLEREIALKVLHPHLTGPGDFDKRFAREAITTAALSHPNIVQIFDYGREGTRHFLAMEYLPGPSVGDFVHKSNPFPLKISLHIGLKVAEALAYAHRTGVVHRDVKPSNILIAHRASIKVVDFGIARLTDSAQSRLTQEDKIVGTPNFMSPEQIKGTRVGPPSDIFSLGIFLYQIMVGIHPFGTGSSIQLMHNILEAKFLKPDSVNADLPKEVSQLLRECLQGNPKRRPGSMEIVAEKLKAQIVNFPLPDPKRDLADFCQNRPTG